MLGFAAQWVIPLLTAVVAGDIFASEDQHGTWKSVLTRSTSRGQLFWATTLTAAGFAVAVLIVLAASTVASSVLIVGHHPLTGLTGQTIPAAEALRLVALSWATMLPPMLGFTCLAILLSVWSHNPAVGVAAPVVIGMVMQLVGALGYAAPCSPPLAPRQSHVRHGRRGEQDIGPGGDWNCLMSWTDPEVPMPPEGYGKFELNVHSNDCYTAGGPSKLTGFLTMTDTRGRVVTNPLFEFDGCFNPRGDNTPTGVVFPSLVAVASTTITPDAGRTAGLQVTCGSGDKGCAAAIAVAARHQKLGRSRSTCQRSPPRQCRSRQPSRPVPES